MLHQVCCQMCLACMGCRSLLRFPVSGREALQTLVFKHLKCCEIVKHVTQQGINGHQLLHYSRTIPAA